MTVTLREFSEGCCQTKANSSQYGQVSRSPVCAERRPLGESSDTGLLVGGAVRESAFGIEVVVHGSMDRSELPRAMRMSEP